MEYHLYDSSNSSTTQFPSLLDDCYYPLPIIQTTGCSTSTNVKTFAGNTCWPLRNTFISMDSNHNQSTTVPPPPAAVPTEEYFNDWGQLKVETSEVSLHTLKSSNCQLQQQQQPRAQKRKSPPNHVITTTIGGGPATTNGHVKKICMVNGVDDRLSSWHVNTMTNLNEDIDNSINHLPSNNNGRKLATATPIPYNNVSETILAISDLSAFKQEAPSPPNNNNVNINNLNSPINNNVNSNSNNDADNSSSSNNNPNGNNNTNSNNNNNGRENLGIGLNSGGGSPLNPGSNNGLQMDDGTGSHQNMINTTITQLLNQTAYSNLQNAIDANLTVASPTAPDPYANVTVPQTANYTFTEDCRFQYVLAAATSIATKVNEDTLTYLNQGQSYEIKLKKLGDLSMYRGKMLKSVIRICFHERRLQYMEKEQMALWQHARPGDRILEVDVPLSYGTIDIVQPLNALNMIHFNWDPTKEVGVYIKVNCISTEFTPKKHGGEKGVPFRIQVETYQNGDGQILSGGGGGGDSSLRLHAAACQIKVFKLKGADRKHKQDREKIMKRPIQEQDKYQPSYECTVLNDIPIDSVLNSPSHVPVFQSEGDPQNSGRFALCNTNGTADENSHQTKNDPSSPILLPTNPNEQQPIGTIENEDQLMVNSTPDQTVDWLLKHRFDKYVEIFSNFSGTDMLRMNREDLIQICGNIDGIRLYNVLHLRPVTPKLRIYICQKTSGGACANGSSPASPPTGVPTSLGTSTSNVYQAIYLSNYSQTELQQKLVALLNLPLEAAISVVILGPQSIRIEVTDNVVRHMKDEALYTVDVLHENSKIVLLLKC